MNYFEKRFMILTPVANSQNFFWRSLCFYQHIALSFDYGYAARIINYIEKSFMKLTPVANSQNFFGIVYAAITVSPYVLTMVLTLGT